MRAIWCRVGSVLEWTGALTTLALVWFQVTFSDIAKDYALDARLLPIEQKIDVVCHKITGELLDLRDAALSSDELAAYITRQKLSDSKYPFSCDYKKYWVQEYPEWPRISRSMYLVENWMIAATAIITIIGLLLKSRAKEVSNKDIK